MQTKMVLWEAYGLLYGSSMTGKDKSQSKHQKMKHLPSGIMALR